jgi:hypothetical protein
MKAQNLVRRVAAAYSEGVTKVATFPPFSKNGPPPLPSGSGESGKRNIPKDHPFDAKALKPMAQALWATSVSLGHAWTAYRHLNRLKSTRVSPDGMLGGRGYVMAVKDIRQKMYAACEALSSIADTIHDEIEAPHWKPKLAQLDSEDQEGIERFVEKSQDLLDNPEDEAEDEMKAIEEGKSEKDEDNQASKLPTATPAADSEAQPMKPATKEAFWTRLANSSVSPDELPGPRVDHLDRGEQLGPWGSYNVDEEPSDNWFQKPKEYEYPHEGDNDLREATRAESVVPDSTTEDTPTEAWDFGLGYGANGQGAGGYQNPSDEGAGTKGVWGPHSGLPGSPSTPVNDTTPVVDVQLNERHALQALLPGDTDEPVARSDYFQGWKGNLVQSESELPQEPSPTLQNAPSLPNTDYVSEDGGTAYVRYDYSTHTFREDPLHNWPQEKLPENTWPQQG